MRHGAFAAGAMTAGADAGAIGATAREAQRRLGHASPRVLLAADAHPLRCCGRARGMPARQTQSRSTCRCCSFPPDFLFAGEELDQLLGLAKFQTLSESFSQCAYNPAQFLVLSSLFFSTIRSSVHSSAGFICPIYASSSKTSEVGRHSSSSN